MLLHHVFKQYDGRRRATVLHDVNLEVTSGEFVAIMGPSGAGKSTLLNILGLLDRPTSGKYYLESQEVSRSSDHQLAAIRNQDLGFIFQTFNLVPTLSALENVELPLIYRNLPTRRRRPQARRVLEHLGLSNRMDFRPNELSGGQQQRVAIARALVTNPRVLLADEPTGNLDQKNASDVLEVLRDLHREGHPIVLITHDPEIASQADTIYAMNDGTLTPTHHGKGWRAHADG